MKYPNMIKKETVKGKKCSSNINYINRGMKFEEEINIANEFYKNNNIALIYKKPTPIRVVKMFNDKNISGKICEAYFEQPSTTDYNGVFLGKYVDFEAKETMNKTSFPLANIHAHQVEHLLRVAEHGGIGFIIVNFKLLNKIFILDGSVVGQYYKSTKKSIPYSVFEEKGFLVKQGYILTIDYISTIKTIYFNKKNED
ncbi:MAG: Holliday junction resolvase RecU [Bacilli bacterium]|nr:Holliday junction resolvase RecU [Bacilli bacterium]